VKVSSQDYVDPAYKQLMRNKRGRKLVKVLRILAEGIMTKNDVAERTAFSASEVRELLKKGVDQGYINTGKKVGKASRRRGHPFSMKSKTEMDTGRPPGFYNLSSDGIWLMRLDPEVRDRWSITEENYQEIVDHDVFHSYLDLLYAIRVHPKLKKHQKPSQLMENELQQTVLAPFVLGNEHGIRDIRLYEELVKTIRENVRSEHVLGYYLALEASGTELDEIVRCYKLLLEVMKKLPEVQEYLKKHPSQ
jgi:DNA-binding Lrp family transcriptional regulator